MKYRLFIIEAFSIFTGILLIFLHLFFEGRHDLAVNVILNFILFITVLLLVVKNKSHLNEYFLVVIFALPYIIEFILIEITEKVGLLVLTPLDILFRITIIISISLAETLVFCKVISKISK